MENEKQIPDGPSDWHDLGLPSADRDGAIETSLEEWRYLDLLKTMLAEVIPLEDPIFDSTSRSDVESEVLKCGMTLPIVRVIPDVGQPE